MNNTIIQQGKFTSTGTAKTLQIRSDVDWMQVWNLTEATTATASHGVSYYWQRGLAANNGFATVRNGAATADLVTTAATLGVDGFTLVDSSSNPVGASRALTSISNATPPRATVASTTGLATGDVVRIINTTGGQQLGGLDFTITVVGGTTFDLAYMSPIVVAGGPGTYRVIKFNPLYYPRRRYISSITQASSAVVKMTVTHGYTVGQVVRFVVPAAYGMTEMNGLTGTITAVDTVNNTITVNIDSSAFTAFAFPLTAAVPFTPAEVIPVGEDTAEALSASTDILADATVNTGYIGMVLGAGITSPAGSNGDEIYWVAGKSFSVDN